MALKAAIFKCALDIADGDRGYYGHHDLTLARHPSETDERLMVRVLAFALHAHDRLEFGRGLSNEDEPALAQQDLTGAVERWIEVGLPDERRLRRACGRADKVCVVAYGGRAADLWWQQNQRGLAKLPRLTVLALPASLTEELARRVSRSMAIHISIDGRTLWLDDGQGPLSGAVLYLQDPDG